MGALLQLNSTINWGSTGKIAEQIGLVVKKYGWKSYIAYGRYENPSQSISIKIESMPSVYNHYIENRLLDREGLASKYVTYKLIKKIKEIKPSIIQLHNLHDHYLNYKILFEYLNKTDIPIVWTFHDCWAFTGHCTHFVSIDCEKWKTLCNNCKLNKALIDRSQKNFLLKKSLFINNPNLHIVAVSQWIANYVKDSFLSEKSCEVIHNGIDLSKFYPRTHKKDTKFQILAVSSYWNKSKGLFDILKLRKLLNIGDYDITIVGLSKKFIKNLPNGIKGIERTQSVSELCELYSMADVFINLTYADTFPTVNLEALACGTPVITYRTGGSPESIDEYTGSVVEQGDLQQLVAEIKKYYTRSDHEQKIVSIKCRERAEKYFDKDICFQKYIQLYENLLKEKNNN